MKKQPDYITMLFFIITLITGIYFYFDNSASKVIKAILLIICIIVTKIIFTNTFLKNSKIGYYGFIVFEFFSIYLANLFDFYSIDYYDKFLHFTSGIFLYIFGVIILVNLKKENDYKKEHMFWLFPLFFSIAMAGVWEIWEFTTDNLFGLNAQNNSLFDTMTDIICGTLGAVFTNVLAIMSQKGKKISIITRIIEESKK